MTHSDEKLLQDYLQGDRDALGELLQRYLAAFYTLALRMTNSAADAQDIAQEICRRVIESIPTFKTDKLVKPWLYTIAYRTVLSFINKKPATVELGDCDWQSPSTGGSNVEQQQQQEALDRAIAGLPEELQLPVILHYYHKMTYKEIGGVVGCSDANVHKRIHKALDVIKLTVGAGGVVLVAGQIEGMLNAATLSTAPAPLTASVAGMAAAAPVLSGATAMAATGALITGGTIMTAKSMTITLIIGALCLVSGFGLRSVLEQTPEMRHEDKQASGESAQLEQQKAELTRLQQAAAGRQHELSALREELETLKADVDAKNQEILALREELSGKTVNPNTTPEPAPDDLEHATESVLMERFEEICKKGLGGFNDPEFTKITEGFKNLGARGVDVLAGMLAEHTDMMHRFFAAAMLGATESPEALDPLFAAIRGDKEMLVRRMASQTFFTMDIEAQKDALRSIDVLADIVSTEADWGVKVNAFVSWLKHSEKWNKKDPDLGADMIALFNQMGEGKNFAMETLQILVDQDSSYLIALPLFRNCIKAGETLAVRSAALGALAKLDDEESLGAIEELIFHDADANIVKAAKRAYNTISGTVKYPD